MGFNIDPTKVRADVFTESGKWKYTVCLDYSGLNYSSWDLWEQAKLALKQATGKKISGVTFDQVPIGWMMVVLDPYGKTEYPIIVKG